MSEVALRLQHSIEVNVSPAFAWSFRTDIANWNDPPATFSLDGPFVAGSSGTTTMPGQAPFHWMIRDVRPGELFVIETELDGATLRFEWRFEALNEHKTRMTQCILLSGDNAPAYADELARSFGPTLAPGMKRIALEMESNSTAV